MFELTKGSEANYVKKIFSFAEFRLSAGIFDDLGTLRKTRTLGKVAYSVQKVQKSSDYSRRTEKPKWQPIENAFF